MKTKHPLDDPQSREALISLRAGIRHDHLGEMAGAEQYLLDLSFKVLAEWRSRGDAEMSFETEAGEIHLRLVRMSVAIEDEAVLSELFDQDQALSGLARLYDWEDPNLEFIPAIREICDVANSFADLFSIEAFHLEPWARRQGVGLRVIDLLLRNWQSGCTLALMNPVPFADDAAEVKKGRRKLTRYFGQLGFQPVSGLPYLARSIEMRPPGLDEVDLPEGVLVPSGLAEKVERSS